MKYKKRPFTIEAFQFESNAIIPAWFTERVNKNMIIEQNDGTYDVNTPEGAMKIHIGDYIILDPYGNVYPCNPKIFEIKYEKVVGRSERSGRISL